MSPGELRNVAARVGGFEALIDRAGKRYVDKGLKYAAPTGPRIEQMLIADPLLLRTPIVRAGNRATVGYAPDSGRAGSTKRRRADDRWNTAQALETSVVRVRGGVATPARDRVAIERPLQIRVRIGDDERALSTTMRTPGDDVALAVGFLHAEGVLADARRSARRRGDRRRHRSRRAGAAAAAALAASARTFVTSAACGVCGRADARRAREQRRARVAWPRARASRRRSIHGLPGASARGAGDVRPHGRAARGRRCSRSTARCWRCTRTSAATTPSTSWSGRLLLGGRAAGAGGRPDGERARQLRAGPEGGGGRHSDRSPPWARRRAWRSSGPRPPA